MLVTFKTDVGNISMFGDVALHMIKLMGHSETVPGAILAKDLPQALNQLNNALTKEKASPPNNEKDEEENTESKISLNQRATPLINLLAEAIDADCDLMWE